MSYILDALRKAERERHRAPVPTLDTTHGEPGSLRRLPRPWAVAGVLALGAVILSLLWVAGRPDPVREASVTAKSSQGEAAPPPPPASGAPASASSGDSGPSGAPVEPSSARGEPVPGLAPGAPTGRPPGGLAPARPRVALVPPPVKTSRAARAADDSPRGPAPAGSPEAPETRRAAAAQLRPTVPATALDQAPIPEPRSGGDPVAPLALTPGPLPDAGASRAARPGSGEALARLTLDVLVYSDVPAERLVFINGRKYVEGQALDAEAVVEQITPEGAVLRHQGQRVVLRPKLNPYARPGSP